MSAADFLLLRPHAVNHMPHSVECGSRWRTYGSSSGWSADVMQPALGEHFERKHFYLDVPVHDNNKLDNSLTPKEYEEFAKAFSQTSATDIGIPLHLHSFDRTNAYRVTDFTQCNIPTACISIAECRNPIDNRFYPMRDTCGCSAHFSVERAVQGALKENLERQFLLRFWLTKTCTGKIGYPEACILLLGSACLRLFTELMNSGDLCALDLTDNRFPGSCILLCYGNQNLEAEVKYCAGMAYADTRRLALEKALIELWQTFRFMQALDQTKDMSRNSQDPYLTHFLACNDYRTYQSILSCTASPPIQAKHSEAHLTLRNLLHAIRDLDLNGYLYLAPAHPRDACLYLCKYISPNIFLHMNNSNNLNIDNTYSAPFLHNIIASQLSHMVPFP
ncbi:YcaO-like family protein [Pseudomonas sp. NPDC089752]|uniref:YcaO-like family protein n=1 Tax=Pseudomonas sp. NPDC089752 TaxID=3364472 RepID=UPI0037F168EB